MGALFRFAFMGLALGYGACWLMHRLTGDDAWRRRGTEVLKWGVVIVMLGLGVFVLRRGAMFI